MKKAVTTNVFNDGLVMDMNPLITSSSVLTNCLNGTLITYNGNENALQNDMGNARVDLAYLPEGYVPLGTAELGGIIYIVSYNPLINKCQIGSFPSPQRNIASDMYSLNCATISNDQFIDGNNNVINTIVKVKLNINNNSVILNPGDKFQVFAAENGIENNKETISDVNSDTKIIDYDPKFVTIHIISIGEDGKITYLDNCLNWNSDLGYYIHDIEGSITELKLIIDTVDSKRNLIQSAYNTFNSKISGELALLFELKVIDSFYLNWDAKISNISDETNDKLAHINFYVNWESLHKNINLSRVILSKSEFNGNPIDENETLLEKIDNRKNDGTDNSIIIEARNFKYNSKDLSDLMWNYEVIPAMPFGKLDYMKIKGSINFSDLGTGKINITRWTYFISDNYLQLNWGLEAYPEINKEIKYIDLVFIPVESDVIVDNSKIEIKDSYLHYNINNRISYSGYYSDFIYFDNSKLEKNKLYIVDITIYYGLKNDSNSEDIHFYKWLYTTGQWNEQFKNTTIEDFSDLTLDTAFDLISNLETIKKNVSPVISYGYNLKKLNSRDKPLDNPYYTMGSRVITVDYDFNNKKFKGTSENLKNKFTIKANKYENLFDYNNSNEDMTYVHSIDNSYITHSDITISSEKESSISDVVNSKFEEEFNLNIELQIDRAINDPDSLLSDWDELGDQFEPTIINNNDISIISLNIKGVIFTRINADITKKSITPSQIIRPILQNTGDYEKLGLDEDGNLNFIFEESHWNKADSNPFIWNFRKRLSSSTSEYRNDFTTSKSYWNPGDDFTRKTYWERTPPYDDYLNYWMLQAKGPIQLLRYGYGYKDSENLWGAVWVDSGNESKRLNRYCGLWIKTNNGHFIPVNNFWETSDKNPTTTNKINEISKYIRLFFSQLYYVDNNTSAIDRYIVDNINTLNPYTENWNVTINTNVTGSVDDVIFINNLNLASLLKKFANIINLNNITYSKNYTHNFKNIITIPFKINMDKIYSIYEDNKLTYIPAIYYISTKDKYEIGPTKNSNNFYTYNDGKFIQTNSKESVIFRSGNISTSDTGDVANNETEYKKINITDTNSKYVTNKISSALRLKDGEFCFDEDTLLVNKFTLTYKVAGGGYAKYYGNSELYLPINSKTHSEVKDSNE